MPFPVTAEVLDADASASISIARPVTDASAMVRIYSNAWIQASALVPHRAPAQGSDRLLF